MVVVGQQKAGKEGGDASTNEDELEMERVRE